MTATVLYTTIMDSATISATNARSSLPASNLQNADITKITRINGDTTQIDVSLSAAGTARQMFLAGLGDTLTGFSTFTIKASTSALGNTDQLNFDGNSTTGDEVFGFDSTYMQAVADFGSDVTAQYWRIDLTGSGVTDLEIGRMLLGPIISTSQNIGYPLGLSTIPQSRVSETYAPRPLVWSRTDVREFSFRWGDGITEADLYDELERKLARVASTHSQVAFVPDLGSSTLGINQAIFGRLREIGSGEYGGYNRYGKGFTVREERRS